MSPRDELAKALFGDLPGGGALTDAVLDNLPLVLAAAEEAGKAEQVGWTWLSGGLRSMIGPDAKFQTYPINADRLWRVLPIDPEKP